MSLDVAPERVCYVHCNFCNTILAAARRADLLLDFQYLSFFIHGHVREVSVPSTILFNVVTVGCGHCANLLPVNMKALVQSNPLHQDLQPQSSNLSSEDSGGKECGSSSSKCNKNSALDSAENEEPPRMLPIRPPEKRQRVPSAYNRFIKEEIQRIKASNPDISHREAFSTAAKNWAHFPHIHFGLMVDGNKRVKIDEAFAGEGTQKKTQGFY